MALVVRDLGRSAHAVPRVRRIIEYLPLILFTRSEARQRINNEDWIPPNQLLQNVSAAAVGVEKSLRNENFSLATQERQRLIEAYNTMMVSIQTLQSILETIGEDERIRDILETIFMYKLVIDDVTTKVLAEYKRQVSR